MEENRLRQQLDFILEVDKLKRIGRQTYLSNGTDKENDAEHSWHLALMALLLKEYADEEVDLLKVVTMVLIHDIVEIDAGDTYAYDTKGNQSKLERETKAADRLFGILPKDQGEYFKELWEEFDQGKTGDAKFANALDKLQPLMLNDATGGKAWKEHEVNNLQVLNRNPKEAYGADTLWQQAIAIIRKNTENGNLIKETDVF